MDCDLTLWCILFMTSVFKYGSLDWGREVENNNIHLYMMGTSHCLQCHSMM